jgi:hypothetical protein
MKTPLKQNVAGFRDDFGIFHPIRSPEYVGSNKRRATAKDRKAYSRKLAGDEDDVFDREIRKERNRKKADKLYEDRLMRQLEREAYGTRSGGRLAQSLVEFVRSEGGIRRTYKFGGKKVRGKKVSYDAGELAPFTYKESGKRGLVTDKGGKTLDGMFQAAREAGYPVTDENDLLDRMDEEIRGNGATYATHGYLDYRDNPLPKNVIATDAELKRLQAATKKLASRRKNTRLKKNPVGWFRDVSPVTPEAVKKLYRQLAAKYHPDKGGDTRTMQEINADYDKAMKIAISGEGNEARAKAETKAAKPLREAIEFAVTLPDSVNVTIRGLWLWLEGSTWAVKDQIKAFKSSDGNRFKFAPKKKAWFFAAVPSTNRRGEMSFDEIERLHGREDVKERRHRQALNPKRKRKNPMHPVSAFAAGTSGILSALQIRDMVKKTKPKRKKTRRKNPSLSAVNKCKKLLAEDERERKAHKPTITYYWKENPATPAQLKKILRDHLANAKKLKRKSVLIPLIMIGFAHEYAEKNGGRVEVKNGKAHFHFGGKSASKKKANPTAKIPHRRTFAMFQGRPATTAKRLSVSPHAPAKLDQLGDLIELKLNSGKVLKFPGKKFKLCAAGGKLWIAGGRFAKANPAGKAREINPIDAIDHVVYGTYKPHHGDMQYTHYIHKLGEETGHMPTLCVDREGYPIIRGGRYKIEARGIVN